MMLMNIYMHYDLYVLKYFGKAITRSPTFKLQSRTDLILWDSTQFTDELTNAFKIDNTIDTTLFQAFLDIIKNNLDSFCEEGTSRPMFDFDFFFLDTGNSPLG